MNQKTLGETLKEEIDNQSSIFKTLLRGMGYINSDEVVEALRLMRNNSDLVQHVVENYYDQVKEALQEQAS